MDLELARYFLPEGILEYFYIVNLTSILDKIHFYLEEKSILPKDYQSEIVKSTVFSPQITVEDFPPRGKTVLLIIKRRRCTLINNTKIIKKDWNLVAKVTRITNEFASFFKRYLLITTL